MSAVPAAKLYSLLDSEFSHRVDNLSREQLEIMIKMIPQGRLAHYLVKEGLRGNWVLLSESDFGVEVSQKTQLPPPLPAREITQTLGVVDETMMDHRETKKYDKAYTITLIQGRHVFSTRTRAISMTGAQLEDRIPAWAMRGCHAVLVKDSRHPQERIEIFCKPAGGKSMDHITFEKCSSEDLLRQWILRY